LIEWYGEIDMSDREAFEKTFAVPNDAFYNADINGYCWRVHPFSEHPFDATYEGWSAGWQAAQAQASKPIAAVHGWYDGRCVIEPLDRSMAIPVGMALYSQPQAQATPWKYDAILDKFMPDFKAQARNGEVNLLAKNQDCGCVICTCENDVRCMGCGAKHCGTHPVGQIPRPKYIQ
jgi:hypothetical protein